MPRMSPDGWIVFEAGEDAAAWAAQDRAQRQANIDILQAQADAHVEANYGEIVERLCKSPDCFSYRLRSLRGKVVRVQVIVDYATLDDAKQGRPFFRTYSGPDPVALKR